MPPASDLLEREGELALFDELVAGAHAGAGGLVAIEGRAGIGKTRLVAEARIRPQDMAPLVGAGFKPTDRDEIGLWQLMDRAEEEIASTNLLIQDPKLTGYLKNIIGTVGGPAAQDFRIYLARIPDFNAMMFPSGFAVVFSGLLLRMRNEAQLAGVIAHESGHFLRRHMIRSWRDERRKTDLFAVGSMLAGIGGAGAGVYLGDYVNLAELGTLLSLFSYSREMEAEADAMGIKNLAAVGYPPIEMSTIWQQLIGEETASAHYRRKNRHRGGLFDTHPSSDARMADLKADAADVTRSRCRLTHRHVRTGQGSGQARTGSPDSQRFTSSASSRAV